jgi:hypothetical protein
MQKALAALRAVRTYLAGKGALLAFALFFVFVITGVAGTFLYAREARAAVNSTMNFQARVLQANGAVIPDGSINVQFNLYNVSSGGTTQWTETQSLTAKNGYITASLGSITPFPGTIDWSQEQWLTLNVNSDGEMNPRMKVTGVPYAFRSGQADSLTNGSGTISASQLAQLAPGSIQGVNSGNTALRINQTGAGNLLQLQGDGNDRFTVSKAGDVAASGGITIGTSTSTTAGTLRWNGVDFEGYDGSQWVSLTATGGGGGGAGIGVTVVKTAAEIQNNVVNPTATLQPDDELFFAIGANETWTYRFVVQINSPAAADLKFSVTAPGGATCTTGVINAEDTVTAANLGCGVSSGIMNTATTDEVYEIVGTVVNGGTAGNVTLQWAQNTANAANSTSRAGGYLFATSQGASNNYFKQSGNAFGANAVLGTTDNYNLNLITNGSTRLSVTNTGSVSIVNDLTVGNGLTVTAGGADITGGLELNSGNITGVGNITAVAGLTISSGGSNSITLDSGNDVLVLADNTLRRTAAGITNLELNDTSDTTLSLINTDATAVANLDVEGEVTAASFVGSGSGLTALNASNITSGTLDDGRLSNNVALLDTSQVFLERPTFNKGIVLGNGTVATDGALRWTGSDFEGYNGTAWVSLTSGGGGGGGATAGVTSVIKTSDEIVNNSNALQDDNHLTFAVGANEKWTYRFVVQANSAAAADLQFAVSAPSGATCDTSVINSEEAEVASNLGCGVASSTITTNGSDETYEIIGTVQTSATAGNVTLRWAQATADGTNTTVYIGSSLLAVPESINSAFVLGGNSFGANAVLGTNDNYALTLETNGTAALVINNSQNITINQGLTVSGSSTLNGGVVLGDASGDTLTINSSALSVPNGLNIDSNTLVIDAINNRIGLNNATPDNLLTLNTPATSDGLAQAFIYTNADTNKGLVVQATASQSANLLEIQRSTGAVLAAFDDTGQLILGNDSGSPQAGLITLNDSSASNGFTNVLGTSTLTGNRTITLPDEDGVICISNSENCGFALFAPSTAQDDSSTNSSLFINKTGATGNILTLQDNGTTVLSVLNNGALQLQLTDANAFNIKNAGGTDYFNVDTSGGLVRIGGATADASATLLVLDTKNTANDPSGVDGGMYYNSNANKFRCYQNGVWRDCLPAGYSEYAILAAPVTYTNLPAADTEFINTPRLLTDLTYANEFRLVINRPAGTVTAGTDCRIQYASAQGGPWTNLDGGAGPEVDVSGAAGIFNSAWTALDAGAKGDRYLRVMCKQGNGTTDPQFRNITIQVR